MSEDMEPGDVISRIGCLGRYLTMITPSQSGLSNYGLVRLDGVEKGMYKIFSKALVDAEFIVVEKHGEMLCET